MTEVINNENITASPEKGTWWKSYKYDPGVYPTHYGEFVRENKINYKDIARLTGISKNMTYQFSSDPMRSKMTLKGASRVLAALREITQDDNLIAADIFRKSHARKGFNYEDIDREAAQVDLSAPPVPIGPLPENLTLNTPVGRLYRMESYMDHNGASVEDLMDSTGLRRQNIIEIMNLEYGAKWWSASLIAEALGTTVDSLRGYDAEENYESVEPTPYSSDEVEEEDQEEVDDFWDGLMKAIMNRFDTVDNFLEEFARVTNMRLGNIINNMGVNDQKTRELHALVEKSTALIEERSKLVEEQSEKIDALTERLEAVENKIPSPKKRFWQS